MPDYTVHLGPSVVTNIGEQQKTEVPSTKRLGAAAATRVGSGIIGGMMSPIPVVGTGAAFLTGAGGELLAQLLEEGAPDNASEWMKFLTTPSRYGRAALEGGITAIPGGAFVKGGRPVMSALRSGGIAAGGETIRQVVRGDEQFNPMAAGIAGLTGGLIGAAASPFVPRAAVVPRSQPVGTIDDLITQAGQDVDVFKKGLPQIFQREGLLNEGTPTALNARAAALDQTGQTEFASAIRDFGLGHGPWKPADILIEIKSLYSQGNEEAAKALADAAIRSRKGGTVVPDWLGRTVATEQKVADKARKAAEMTALQTNQTDYLRGRLEAMGFGPDEIAAALEKYKARIKPSINIKRSVKDPETGETITETINLSLRKQKEKGGGGKGSSLDPTAPEPSPIPGQYQVVSPEGNILRMSADVNDVRQFVESLGQGSGVKVIEPLVPSSSDKLAQQIAEAILPSGSKAAGEAISAIPVEGVGRAALTEGEEAGIKAADELAALTGSEGKPLNPLGQGMIPVEEAASVLPVQPSHPALMQLVEDGEWNGKVLMTGERVREVLGIEPSEAIAAGQIVEESAKGFPGKGYRMVVAGEAPITPVVPVSGSVSVHSPATLKALMGRGISKEAAEAMTPEEALAQLTTPRAQAAAPVVTQPVAELPMTLTASERVPVLDQLNRELYPAEVADQLFPLQQRYHDLTDQIAAAGKPVKGTPEFEALAVLKEQKGKIGKKMSVIVDEAEDAGLVKPGIRNEWGIRAKELLEDANANKIAEGITISDGMTNRAAALLPEEEAAMLVEKGVVPPERLGALTDDLRAGNAAAAADVPPTPKLADISPDLAAVDDKTATIRQALAEGKITQEEADAQAVQLAEEYLALKSTTKPSEGGTIISAFGGGAEQLFKKYPEFGIKAALIAGGALTGAVTDPMDNPVLSALMGAGAGWSAAKIGSLLKQVNVNVNDIPELKGALKDPHNRDSIGSMIWQLYPHIQRSHFLMSVHGIPTNVIAGPIGSGFFGSLTKALAGDARGGQALRNLSHPKHLWDTWSQMGEQAEMLVRKALAGDPTFRSEVGGDVLDRMFKATELKYGPNAERYLRGYLQGVGLWMTRADLTVRKILMEAGFTEAEARVMTLTSEAEGAWMKTLMNFGRAASNKSTSYDKALGPLGASLFPFIRTPVNIMEQGFQRLPGVGIALQTARGVAPREILAQQAVSSVLLYASYLAGLNTSEENSRTIRRYVSNLGGQYALITSLGFAAGQGGRRMGKSASPTDLPAAAVSPEALKQLTYSMAVPEAGIVENWGQFIANIGKSDKPFIEQLPRGLVPGMFRESSVALRGDETKLSDLNVPPLRVEMPY